MIPVERIRWVQVLLSENHWRDALFAQLEEGDIFRVVEPTGELARGGQIYVVSKTPDVGLDERLAMANAKALDRQ